MSVVVCVCDCVCVCVCVYVITESVTHVLILYDMFCNVAA